MSKQNRDPRAMADAGDVDGLLRILTECSPTLYDFVEVNEMLRRAVEQRAKNFPAEFRDAIHAKMVAFVGYLVLRGQVLAGKVLQKHDRDTSARGTMSQCQEMQSLLPSLVELQRHFAELQQSHAATQRLAELTREKRLANERATKKRKRSPQPNLSVIAPPSAKDLPTNRISKMFDE